MKIGTKYDNFFKRVKIADIGMMASLLKFEGEDLHTFEKLCPTVTIATSEVSGYFVYVGDSSFNTIGESWVLYDIQRYRSLIECKIDHCQRLMDDLDGAFSVHELSEELRREVKDIDLADYDKIEEYVNSPAVKENE